MLIDLSILVTRFRSKEALDNEKIAAFGHMETHFDVMDKEFPLEYLRRDGIVFEALLDRGVSIIGIDFAGMRRGPEHTPKDQYCADRGVFVVENLCNLDAVLRGRPSASCVMHTYPIKFAGLSGLPCRVAAEL